MTKDNSIIVPKERRTARDTIKVTPEEKKAIMRAAKAHGFKGKSEFIRQILMPVIAPYLANQE
jgi:uncharacterized protein (DUF1778 family)